MDAVYQCTANKGHKVFLFGARRLPKWLKCSVCGKRSNRIQESRT